MHKVTRFTQATSRSNTLSKTERTKIYRLGESENPEIMVKRGANYFAAPGVSVTLPIFIPAKHRVGVDFNVPFRSDPLDDLAALRREKSERVIRGLTAESSALFRIKLNEVSGFAVFDASSRYRIDLPRAW